MTTHNLAPYGSFDSNAVSEGNADATFNGVAISSVRCVFTRLEVALEVNVVPWARAEWLVKNGQADGFFAASQKAERDSFASLSDHVAEQKWTWYWLPDAQWNPTMDNFKTHASVASFNGANMQAWLQNNGYNVSANPRDTDTLISMLANGRFDAVLANNLVVESIQNKRPNLPEFESKVALDKPLGVYFSHALLSAYPIFMTSFNNALSGCQ